jgi:hypothetical protein
VDTGSTDSTKEIAESYTDSVYDFEWCDDFAAAKNYAISHAKNDIVMVIDSDEFIEEFDISGLLNLIEKNPMSAGRIRRRNVFRRDGIMHENIEWLNRIFDRRYFCYEGRIHEQVVRRGACDEMDYRTYRTPVTILHTGYDLPVELRREKAERNRKLLERELSELREAEESCEVSGGSANKAARNAASKLPYVLYQLGKSCYMAEDYDGACDYFAQGLEYDLNPALEYVIDMVETYGYAMINAGRGAEALSFESIYGEFGNCADFKFLMGLIYMNNEMFDKAISEFKAAAKYSECRSMGVNSYASFYNIGVICECLGRTKEAAEYYRKCGSYEPALKRMNAIRHDPDSSQQG